MILNETAAYSCKEITVYAGQQFSLDDYIGRNLDGDWYCMSGRGLITIRSEKRSFHFYQNTMNLSEFRWLDPNEGIHLSCGQHSDIVIVEIIRKPDLWQTGQSSPQDIQQTCSPHLTPETQ